MLEVVFQTIAEHLVDQLDAVTLFTSKGVSFEAWCVWESVAAIGLDPRHATWTCVPQPPYASLGVTGSRDAADLLVTDATHGDGVVVEIALIQAWSRNAGIDRLEADRLRLAKPRTSATASLQMIIVASLDATIDEDPAWQQWLRMAKVCRRPADHRHFAPLGESGGQLAIYGWANDTA